MLLAFNMPHITM